MKAQDLKSAINILKTVIAPNTIQPILENVHFEGTRLITTNLDAWVFVDLPDTEIQYVNTTVSVTQLEKVVKNVKDNIGLYQDNKKLKVTAGSLKVTLNCIPSEDYPQPPILRLTNILTLDSEKFLDAINRLTYSTVKEDYSSLSGVRLKVDESGLEMASTDGSRLGRYRDNCVLSPSEQPFEVTIPAVHLDKFAKAMAKGVKDDEVFLEVAEDWVSLKMANVTFLVKTLQTQYPEYNQLIPGAAQSKYRLMFNSKDMVSAINSIKPFMKPRTSTITFEFNEGKAVLRAGTPGVSESETETTYQSLVTNAIEEPLKIAFNHIYLLEAFKAIGSDIIHLSVDSSLSPAVFNGEENYLALVMPVQIK